ncbi:aminotransferase [Paenibacillus swuensis]|uniref:Aminotransferase n=1 Tax=Paenibacillus swuensis TaxID=1178515 RepID=A0A172TNC9_9BACL|nr:PLP-dependent aminotransferase family protein [Paenibacillus swuensis]ANE48548.1 aminotransferase [Paenibacillus swuensis]
MDYVFSKGMGGVKSSAVREILKLTQGNTIISFAGGLPAEELFPLDAVRAAYDRVFLKGKGVLQYNLTEGFAPLREKIAERMALKNMRVTKDEIILTTGSQQSIDLMSRIYLDPGDVVLVENPTYLAALQVFHSRGVQIVAVESDANGMLLDDLASKLAQHKPKMVYVVPTFSNPTGRVWSLERRLGLLQACKANHVLILEDDPYGEVQFDRSETYPTIFSLDEHPHGSAVVYTSTFSKTVAPALRTGWVLGDPAVIAMLARAKQSADLHSSATDQQALYELLSCEEFSLDAHIALISSNYEERMRFMVELLRDPAFEGLTFREPKGGMFIWVELPEGMDAEVLMKLAVAQGVAFVPGSSFYAGEPRRNTLRMNYTHTDRETTVVGMERLKAALAQLAIGQA